MPTVNMHEAKTHLSRLVEKAANGESVVIARAGKPLAELSALKSPEAINRRRIGFMEGEIDVPDNFKEIGREEIEEMFGLND